MLLLCRNIVITALLFQPSEKLVLVVENEEMSQGLLPGGRCLFTAVVVMAVAVVLHG